MRCFLFQAIKNTQFDFPSIFPHIHSYSLFMGTTPVPLEQTFYTLNMWLSLCQGSFQLKRMNNIFSNQFGVSDLNYAVTAVMGHFMELFGRMLQCCFAFVKIFASAWRGRMHLFWKWVAGRPQDGWWWCNVFICDFFFLCVRVCDICDGAQAQV